MQLNELAKIVNEEWLKTKEIRKNIDLDYYQIMPNHFHGIVIINEKAQETGHAPSLHQNVETPYMASPKPKIITLANIIGSFKSAVKRRCTKNNIHNFSRQERYYDRIIRNETELYLIRKYIDENPLHWEIDKNTPENIF
jgi:putative transposase